MKQHFLVVPPPFRTPATQTRRSTFVLETIFRRSLHLKQTDRTCWTIQNHSDELN